MSSCASVLPALFRRPTRFMSMATQLPHIPEVERISPLIIRILGQNPGRFTLQGQPSLGIILADAELAKERTLVRSFGVHVPFFDSNIESRDIHREFSHFERVPKFSNKQD